MNFYEAMRKVNSQNEIDKFYKLDDEIRFIRLAFIDWKNRWTDFNHLAEDRKYHINNSDSVGNIVADRLNSLKNERDTLFDRLHKEAIKFIKQHKKSLHNKK